MTNDLTYSEEIGQKIIGLLDNWVIEEPVTPNNSSENENNEESNINPFLEDVTPTPNKKITENEAETFYNLTVTKGLMYCNRLNIDDLDTVTSQFFIDGLCYWTASSLWQKYNIRVSNDDLEDQYIQSYGGLLYKQGKDILDRFVVTRISNYHGDKEVASNDSVWLI